MLWSRDTRSSVAGLAIQALTAAAFGLLITAVPSAEILQYADRAPDHVENLSQGGLLILFDAGEEGHWLNKVEVYGSHQEGGEGQDFQFYVVDLEGRLLREISLPASVWGGGEADWHDVPLPPVQVPREFGIGLSLSGSAGEFDLVWGEQLVAYGKWAYRAIPSAPLRVGSYDVPESHSYQWSPGSPGEGLWDREWMVRAYVDAAPDGDPEGTDLVMLRSGEAFFDRVVSADGDPLDIVTAAHGRLPREEVAGLRPRAVRSPAMADTVITLTNGTTVEGVLVSLDEETATVRSGGKDRAIRRSDIAAIDFRTITAVPIADQLRPAVSQTRRGWGPEQATGAPDTDRAGDIQTAWATRRPDGGEEWLLLTYDTAVDVAEVRVRETYNPGAVSKVVAVLEDGTEVLLWEGQDPTTEAPADFVVEVAEAVHAKRIKVYLDTTREQGWNEIDAVELVGTDGTRQWASSASASSSYADQ